MKRVGEIEQDIWGRVERGEITFAEAIVHLMNLRAYNRSRLTELQRWATEPREDESI